LDPHDRDRTRDRHEGSASFWQRMQYMPCAAGVSGSGARAGAAPDDTVSLRRAGDSIAATCSLPEDMARQDRWYACEHQNATMGSPSSPAAAGVRLRRGCRQGNK
jgi:hypothetical protein